MDQYREAANQMLLAISGPLHSHGGPEDWEHALAIATDFGRQCAQDAAEAMREACQFAMSEWWNSQDVRDIHDVLADIPSVVPTKE